MIVCTILAAIACFIYGIFIGLNYRSKKDLDEMLNTFAETEHLRRENKYLIDKLRGAEGETPALIIYECDGKVCPECNNPYCQHTFDIRHARNFKHDGENRYIEKIGDEREESE